MWVGGSGEEKVGRGLASVPGLPISCSWVCIGSNAQEWKSSEKWGMPGIVHHVNNIVKVGPVTSSPSRWLDLSVSLLVQTLDTVDNFAQPVF